MVGWTIISHWYKEGVCEKSTLKLKRYLWGKVENSIVEYGDTVSMFGKHRHGGHSLKKLMEKGSVSK